MTEPKTRSRAHLQARLASVGLTPIALDREQAAAYVGLSPNYFTRLIEEGLMPPPKQAGSRLLWDVRELGDAFARLPSAGPANARAEDDPWSRVRV